ncbi:MAG: hypothetical protein HY820_33910 [Acidobacteria bacterium]|nr:hypothetical protein [Acidobacteriota bacterium]
MPAIQILDTTSSPQSLLIGEGPTTLRHLIRARVKDEVDRYNVALPEVFHGLVQPEESEAILNGFRLRTRRHLDWEAQFRRACSSFENNGFLVLVDGRQVTDLDADLELHDRAAVEFLKLVPLVGG